MALNELATGHWNEAILLCQPDPSWNGRHCLAMAYYKLGRRDEGAQLLRGLKKEFGDSLAYQYAQVYAQWGEPQQSLEWLVTAVRLKDPGLSELRTDPCSTRSAIRRSSRKPRRGWLKWSETISRARSPDVVETGNCGTFAEYRPTSSCPVVLA